MKDTSYMSLSTSFAQQLLTSNYTTGEIALYHALLDLKNIDMRFKREQDTPKNWLASFDLTSDRLQMLSGLSASGVLKARNKLKEYGLIDFKSRGRHKSTLYWLKDTRTSSTVKSVDKSVVKSIDKSVDKSVDKSAYNSNALTKQDKTKQNKTNTSDKSQATRHKTKPKFSDDATEMKLAMHLFAKIKENNPEHRPLTDSQKQTWADNIRLMIERDQRTPQQIKGMIDWCQQDDFWKQNILSTAKLRKQYDKMKIRANEEVKRRPASDLTFEERFARSQQNRSRQSELFEERFKRAQEARGVR